MGSTQHEFEFLQQARAGALNEVFTSFDGIPRPTAPSSLQ